MAVVSKPFGSSASYLPSFVFLTKAITSFFSAGTKYFVFIFLSMVRPLIDTTSPFFGFCSSLGLWTAFTLRSRLKRGPAVAALPSSFEEADLLDRCPRRRGWSACTPLPVQRLGGRSKASAPASA